MAVGFRSSSNTGNDIIASVQTVNVPTGAAIGDVMIAKLSRWGGAPAVTAPSGFTDWGTAYLSGDGVANQRIYHKRLTVADLGVYQWSWSGALFSHVHCLCMTGVISSGNPIEAVNAWAGDAGSFGSTSVSTATIPGLIWSCYNDSAGSHVMPTGYTEEIDFDCGAAGYRIGSATGTQTASGATTSNSSPSAAILIALKPEGGAAATSDALKRDKQMRLGALLQM